jgi:hypothetical protein
MVIDTMQGCMLHMLTGVCLCAACIVHQCIAYGTAAFCW